MRKIDFFESQELILTIIKVKPSIQKSAYEPEVSS